MKQKIEKTLYDCCITASAAIKEIGISRNAFYKFDEKNNSNYYKFILSHSGDFIFTPEKFEAALAKSGLTQLEVADKTGIHNVTLNLFLHGKMRPSRASGDYDAVRGFCKEYML